MRYSKRLAVLSIIAVGASAGGQDERPTQATPVFPSRVNVTRLDVVAIDATGQPIADLAKDEIQIFENGKPQDVVSLVAISYPKGNARVPEPIDVVSNTGTDDGRLVFLILDDANALKVRTEYIKQAAVRVVQRLSAQDWIGMLWVSKRRSGAVEFTRDHALVLHAIESFAAEQSRVERWFGPDDLVPGPTNFLPGQLSSAYPAAGEEQALTARVNPKALFDAERPLLLLKDISDHLRSIEARRRVIVYVGQGSVRLHSSLSGEAHGAELILLKAIAAAKEANVSIYGIDVSDPAVRDAKGPSRKEGAQIGELRGVSAATGGVTSVYSDPVEAADRVVDDTSMYYLLGYSTEQSSPTGPRRIEVRTTRPGVRLLAPATYVRRPAASAPAPREESARSVQGLLPQGNLNLKGFAAPFADSSQKKQQVAVAIEVQMPKIANDHAGDPSDDIDMTLVAAAPSRGVVLSEQITKISLNTEQIRSTRGRFVLLARIAIDPGRYQLRVGVHSAAVGRTGSVYIDVAVPNFSAQALSLSGLIVGEKPTSTPFARGQELASLIPFPPSLTRDFSKQAEAFVFARAYLGKGAKRSPVTVSATLLRSDTGETAWTSRQTLEVGSGNTCEYRLPLPLSALPSGPYRLEVVASQEGVESAPSREMAFRVLD